MQGWVLVLNLLNAFRSSFSEDKHYVQEEPAKKQKECKTHSGVCIPSFLGMEALFLSFVLVFYMQYYYLEKRLIKSWKPRTLLSQEQPRKPSYPAKSGASNDEELQQLPLTVNSFLNCTCPWHDTLLLLLLHICLSCFCPDQVGLVFYCKIVSLTHY
jgi:hypothetical protein